jgi:DNA repair exonuclease SbcCD ATPase subunit
VETEFEELVLENFGPFKGKHKFAIGRGGSLTFVKGHNKLEPRLGSNGAGKSKLLNSIAWCLYGKTTNNQGTTAIRPWLGKDKTSVTIKFTTWDGDEGVRHKITRTAGPNSLTLDGKTCSQEDIEDLIGMSLSVFRLAPFLGQGQPLFHDLPNREKLQFLVDVLNLNRWDEYSDRAKEITTETVRKLDRTVGEIAASAVRVDELKAQVERQKAAVDQWEAERLELLNAAQAKIKGLERNARTLGDNHAAAAVKLDEAEHKLKLDIGSARKLNEAAYQADLEYRAVVSRMAQVEAEHERARAELRLLKEERKCPSCGQEIKRESRYIDNIEAVEERIRQYAKELNSKASEQAKDVADKAKHKARVFDKGLDELRAQVEKLADDETCLRREMESAGLALTHQKQIVAEFENGENPHRDRLAELRTAVKKATTDATALEKKRDDLEIEAERSRYWIKGFKDVRLHVLEDTLIELEFATNSALDSVGLVGWEVKYAVERETKSGTIARGLITTVTSPTHSGDVAWESWSGGEAHRLRLAGALALSEVLLARAGASCNIEVLDEPTRHLSPEGVSDLCEFLADRAHTLKKSIYLIDHMAIESTYFDQIITVSKDKHGSSISGA